MPADARARLALTRAFLNQVTAERFDKAMLLAFLKLAFELNERDGYGLQDFLGWQGRILIMTAEGDPGYVDTEYLTGRLPLGQPLYVPEGLCPSCPADPVGSVPGKSGAFSGRGVDSDG